MTEVRDLGVVAACDEPRTAAVCVNAAGDSRLVVASRGWVLVVDPVTGGCHQLHFPGPPEFPFASLASRTGAFWTAAGTALHEVDPFAQQVTTHWPCPEGGRSENVGMGFAEGPDGRIWFTSHPDCRLFVLDPTTGQCEARARLSDTEQYAVHLAVAADGRVYAGIGTEHRDLVVVSDDDPQPRSIVPGGRQGKGSGYVHLGEDGQVYGHWGSDQLHPEPGSRHQWHRITAAGPEPVADAEVSPSRVRGRGFARIHVPHDPGWTVERLDLPGRELLVADRAGGERLIRLDYVSVGAKLSPFAETADGHVIGTSSHPMRLFRHDPDTGTTADLPQGSLAVAGGNVCAWTRVGTLLYGAAYAGGHLYRYDPAAPTSPTNPRHLVSYEQVHRPRCAVSHPDGRHVIWGGYGGYGDTGGGLAVHLADGSPYGTNRLIEHTDLVPHQATTALGVLAGGDLVGATSVATPGGAAPRASTAVVYRLSWPELEVVAVWEPGRVTDWAGLAVTPADTLHLVSSDGHHVHLDVTDGSVLDRSDWTAYGSTARGAVVADPEAPRVAVLQERGITLLDLDDGAARHHAWSGARITAGGVLRGDTLLLAAEQRLFRVRLADC